MRLRDLERFDLFPFTNQLVNGDCIRPLAACVGMNEISRARLLSERNECYCTGAQPIWIDREGCVAFLPRLLHEARVPKNIGQRKMSRGSVGPEPNQFACVRECFRILSTFHLVDNKGGGGSKISRIPFQDSIHSKFPAFLSGRAALPVTEFNVFPSP